MKKAIVPILPLLFCLGCSGEPDPRVFFVDLKDGAKVKSPLTVKMGVEGMKLVPAMTEVENKKAGHHHIIVGHGSIPMDTVIIDDKEKGYHHYGKAQKEGTIELKPGKHKLTLQFADGNHKSYGKAMSATIEVTVE